MASTAGTLTTQLGLDVDSKSRVGLQFGLEAGRITGWRASFLNLVTSIDPSEVEVPPELLAFAFASSEASFDMSGTFEDPGTLVTVEAPPPNKTIAMLTDERAMQDALAACERR